MVSTNTVNRIVFFRKNYKTPEEMHATVSRQMQVLMETGYICVVYEANFEGGVLVIEFNPNAKNEELQYPHWLFPDEAEYLKEYQTEVELQFHREEIDRLEGGIDEPNEPKKYPGGDA